MICANGEEALVEKGVRIGDYVFGNIPNANHSLASVKKLVDANHTVTFRETDVLIKENHPVSHSDQININQKEEEYESVEGCDETNYCYKADQVTQFSFSARLQQQERYKFRKVNTLHERTEHPNEDVMALAVDDSQGIAI